ncbi:ribonuclease E/G [Phaeobacter sp. HS012]|uniref:Rne/Rng family ribonuclease n=1 Tax=unclassified Phaeobacter TaxID=2621772 RepID=UPI001B382C9B|nr:MULTISPECIES: ribonuclease E/G [unclassified Phaeobacter]MBQ4806687.1 ribonuclease E/G [Phaeobacter sp. HS012]MBQ4881537.1 ribonuclease E/G [Phaeobacter sp. HS011]
MAKKMLIDATHAEETRVVVVDGNKVEEFDFESENKRQLAGNIYLAKVTRVEPSLQAAFVDYGGNRHGFLAFSEIHPDYYQIPVADREALMEEERAYAEAQRARDDEEDAKPARRQSRSRRGRTKAADVKSADVVETKDVSPETAENGADIAGMETIDLTDEVAVAETKLADVPEAAQTEAAADDATAAEPVVEEAVKDASDTPDAQDASSESGEAEGAADTATTEADDAADDADADDSADKDAAADATAKDENIESVADEDDSEDIRPVRKPRPRRYKIQEVIKVRQVLLVQVVKEERGNKGAALTTYLSLAGRYCVLMPNTARGGGISRKITNAADRKKLKDIAVELDVPTGAGLIVRTAGAKRTKSEIKRDYEYLQRLWEQIRELTLKSIAPAKIYEEGDLIKRSIRDLYSREIDEVLVEGERGYRIAKDFMKMIMPSHAKNVKNYQDQLPLFARFQVESYLGAMFNPTVQLKSGGYIVIGVTEALVAIDVNSGRATKEGSIEETALKTNLEAAEEVARQLRLRDLAGLIVIDFIDMDERKNNAAVEKRMKDKLKTDRARIQVGRISGFGLMEMSRQRLRPGMIEATTAPCPHCHGTGLIRSDDSLALSILRQIEEEGTRRRSREVLVRCPVSIANYLMNQKREHIAQIETRYGLSVRIEGDPHLVSPDFSLEKFKTASRVVPVATAPVVSVDTSIMDQVDADEAIDEADEAEVETNETDVAEVQAAGDEGEGDNKPKRKRRRRRRRKSSGADGDDSNNAAQGDANADDQKASDDAAADDADAQAEPAESSDAKEAEGDGEVKKRTRTRTRSRSRKKKTDETVAAEAEAPAETDAKAEPEGQAIVTEAKAEDSNAAEAEAPVASAEAPVEGVEEPVVLNGDAAAEVPAAAEAETAAATEEAAPAQIVADEATAEDVVADQDTPAAEATAPEAADAPTEEPEAAPEPALATAEAEPASPPKPKRRGWWSVGS